MNCINILKDTLLSCELAFKENPDIFPLKMAIDQIAYLIEIEEGRSNDLSKLNKINIGWIATRELDGFFNDVLINKLHLISLEAEKIKKEKN